MFHRFLSVAGIVAFAFSAFIYATRDARADGETTYVALIVDGAARGEALVLLHGNSVALDEKTVRDLALTITPNRSEMSPDGTTFIPLALLVPQVRASFDERTLTLSLVIVASETQQINVAAADEASPAPAAPSAYANYTVHADPAGETTAIVNGAASAGRDRLDVHVVAGSHVGSGTATLERDDVKRATSIRAGSVDGPHDGTLVGSGPIVGISAQRDPGLRPSAVTFPRPVIGGIASVPGTADVYVDGSLVRSVSLGAGPYALHDVPTRGNGGRVDVVLRGVDGSTTHAEQRYVTDPTLLAQGATSYAYQAGIRSDTHRPIADLSYRIGASERTTLGSRIVATPHATVAELSSTLEVGSSALLRVAAARSRAGNGIETVLRMPLPGGGLDCTYVRRPVDTIDWPSSSIASLGFALSERVSRDASLVASFGHETPLQGTPFSTLSLSMQRAVGTQSTLSLALERRSGGMSGSALAVAATMAMRLGRHTPDAPARTVTLNATNGSTAVDATSDSVTAFGMRTGVHLGTGYNGITHEVRTPAGEFGVALQQYGRRTNISVVADGAVAAMDRHAGFLPHIEDGFALIELPGFPGAAVSLDHRAAGTIGRHGTLFVNGLNGGMPSDIAVDYAQLPVDVQLETPQQTLRPLRHGGAVAHFAPRSVRLIEGQVVWNNSSTVPAYAAIDIASTPSIHARLDERGRFALDGLAAGTFRFEVRTPAGTCSGHLTVPQHAAVQVDLGIITCAA